MIQEFYNAKLEKEVDSSIVANSKHRKEVENFFCIMLTVPQVISISVEQAL